MKILLSGSTGLVGSSLVPHLRSAGHTIVPLRRSRSEGGQVGVYWDPAAGAIDAAGLEGAEAVVHLAGESIAQGRWTEQKKRRIRDSRVVGTRLLAEALAGLNQPPKVLLCASAVGYYGHRDDEWLTEQSPAGSGFLAEVCRDWESAAAAAVGAGIRVVHLRFGLILSPNGGPLAKMLLPFKLGLGGRIGSGRQYISWIALDEVLTLIDRVLDDEALAGAINAVAPEPVTNLQFTKTLGRVLGRPTIFPMPAPAVRLLFGEMADEALLASTRPRPARLIAAGYRFTYPQLEPALRHLLER